MKRPGLVMAVMLTVALSPFAVAKPTRRPDGLANVSLVRLSQPRQFNVKRKGLIVVALENCSVIIDGRIEALKLGDHREFPAGTIADFKPAASASPQLALVQILKSPQPLTVVANSLAVHQGLEDASARNETLLIALDDFQISDERALTDEGKPWTSARAKSVRLRKGETTWLEPGMHRVQNVGSSNARFLTIEW